jgi:hypothetical protein
MKSTIYYGEARFVLDDDEIKGKFHKKERTKRAGYRWQLQKAVIECRMRSETAKREIYCGFIFDEIKWSFAINGHRPVLRRVQQQFCVILMKQVYFVCATVRETSISRT